MLESNPELLNNKITFRNYSDEADLLGMVTVRADCVEHDQIDTHSIIESVPNIKDLESSLQDNHSEPDTDILIVETNNTIVGYSQVEWWDEEDGTRLYLQRGYLLPNWRGKGIDQKMLEWSENNILAKVEKDKPEKPVLGANASSTEKDALALFEKNGYKIVWNLVEMEFTDFDKLPTPNIIPNGFDIRPVTKDQIRLIWQAKEDIYSGTWGNSAGDEEEWKEFIHNPNLDTSLWTVAWKDDKLAGFVISEIVDGIRVPGEVSVLPEYRRKGLGKYLVIENLKLLQKRGLKMIRFYTDDDNHSGAKSLYESVGFNPLKTHFRLRKEIRDMITS